MKYGMKFEELEDKLCKVFHVDKIKNKIMITYRYPTVVQPTVLQYEPIPVSDDENMEIIFATINSHPCLSGVELYIDVPLIGDITSTPDLEDYEVAD